MAKTHKIRVYFLTKAIFLLCHAPPCGGFQTKDAIELENCKQEKIWCLLCLTSGSLVLDLRIS